MWVVSHTSSAMQPAEVVEIPLFGFSSATDELVAAQGALRLLASPNSPSGHPALAAIDRVSAI